MFDDWLKTFPHVSHECGFSPECMSSCFFMSDFLRKFLSHLLHWNGFIFVCIRRWVDRLDILLKYFPHTLHLNFVTVRLFTLMNGCGIITSYSSSSDEKTSYTGLGMIDVGDNEGQEDFSLNDPSLSLFE